MMLGGDGREGGKEDLGGKKNGQVAARGQSPEARGPRAPRGGRRDRSDRREATARLGEPASERERSSGAQPPNGRPPGAPAGAGVRALIGGPSWVSVVTVQREARKGDQDAGPDPKGLAFAAHGRRSLATDPPRAGFVTLPVGRAVRGPDWASTIASVMA
ncbi:hypothetical protein VTN96DRAFT_2702 [Rasamsonia emersonii]